MPAIYQLRPTNFPMIFKCEFCIFFVEFVEKCVKGGKWDKEEPSFSIRKESMMYEKCIASREKHDSFRIKE